jgi:hypothetical protein
MGFVHNLPQENEKERAESSGQAIVTKYSSRFNDGLQGVFDNRGIKGNESLESMSQIEQKMVEHLLLPLGF